jgi:putative aldouronate transport system substrate-binding protein
MKKVTFKGLSVIAWLLVLTLCLLPACAGPSGQTTGAAATTAQAAATQAATAAAATTAAAAATAAATTQAASAVAATTAAGATQAAVSGNRDGRIKDSNIIGVGAIPAFTETVPLSIGFQHHANIEDLTTNLMTTYMEENLNMSFTFVDLPADGNEFLQKFELMAVSGGDLPDIVITRGNELGGVGNLEKYGQADIILPTTEYYEYLPYWMIESISATNIQDFDDLSLENLLRYVTSNDGNIYGVMTYHPSLTNSVSMNFQFLYKPFLEALNITEPTTTEEYREVLRALKYNDPNGNGLNDEYGLIGQSGNVMTNLMRPLMIPFQYIQNDYFDKNADGIIGFAPVNESYREGLRYIKSLVDEGLIEQVSFTQDNSQLTTLLTAETVTIGALASGGTGGIPATDIRRTEYEVILPLTGPTGLRQAIYQYNIPRISFVITRNCKTPEAAFILGDFMCSMRMSFWGQYGAQDEHWSYTVNEAYEPYESFGFAGHIVLPPQPSGLFNHTWGLTGSYIGWWNSVGKATNPNTRMTVSRQSIENTYDAESAFMHRLPDFCDSSDKNKLVIGMIYTTDEQEIVTEYRSTINEYVQECFVQFVTGKMDIEKQWDSYVSEYDRMGLKEYLGAVQSASDRITGR